MNNNNTNDHSVSVAILGAGFISDYHFSALKLIPNVHVKAICDVNLGLAQRFAKAKNIPKFYNNLEEMLAQEQLDVVHILTPPNIHFDNASQILTAGVDAFIEKPFCHQVKSCETLCQIAETNGRKIGISHNFLYFPIYENLSADLKNGRLGKIDQIDIVWNKELGQLKGGPYGAWMLQSPSNILFEVAPHSFAHLVDLIGEADTVSVSMRDRIDLPRNLEFYRRWEILGWKDNTSFRLRLSFIDGYPEHYIHIRGTNGVAFVDFENNTYTFQEHTPYLLDIDRYLNVVTPAWKASTQATQSLSQFVLYKMKLSKFQGPFPDSIARTVASFYNSRNDSLDYRISPALATSAIQFAEKVASAIEWPLQNKSVVSLTNSEQTNIENSSTIKPNILVIGGTGFIGRALVKRLCQEGHSIRVLARNPQDVVNIWHDLPIELMKGDLSDSHSVEKAMEGIEYVYHLARGSGKTWDDYLNSDVKPTERLAELCLQYQIKRLFYTSSIAIYNAGKATNTITENTPADPGIMRVAPYARSKVENEKVLMQLHKEKGLPVIIFRPAIVLGSGGPPYHWGIAGWPYSSVCTLWGDGNNQLPIVLVEDVAEAMVLAIKANGIEGKSYNLSSPPSLTANKYLDEFEKRANIAFRRFPTPAWKYYTEAILKWSIKAVGRDPNAHFPSYADCEGRSLASYFDCTKAEKELSWMPEKDVEKIIAKGIYLPVDEFFGIS